MSFLLPRLTVAATVVVAVAGCSLAPTYERPVAPIPANYPVQPLASKPDDKRDQAVVTVTTPGSAPTTAGAASATVAAAAATGALPASAAQGQAASAADLGWSTVFTDPRLQALIRLALDNNRDLRVAVQRVQEAMAQYGIVDSDRYPTLGAGGNAQITRNPENLRGPNSTDSITRYYQAGVGMTAFELDFFGRVKNLSEAAYQQFLATDQARRTVQINLVAQTAEAYFRLRTANELLRLTRSTLESREATLRLVQSRYDVGIASALDLNQARSQVDSIRADLAGLERAAAQAGNALQLILGTPLPADLPEPGRFGKEQVIATIPVGLPSELLERRPDILGAENALKAANANIGAARAAFFPNISITGLLGVASPQLSSLFSGGQGFWQFSPQIQVPLFSGAVAGGLELAEARKNIAVAEYEKAIQLAFREVADALAGEATYGSQLDALRSLEASALETLRLAQLRYETGIDSFLQVQNAQVDLYSTQRAFLQTGMDSLMNRVELYKALGGGWTEQSAQPATAS
ncbi:MAG: efflux transporter outer membrane subunit [Burkholderiaceae bacterium]|jgi:multidrug efflux system outer membrane protein